ncbi:hypothetical protein UNSWDHB_1303 [Dehalobacter sp. UNSWDHB]|nr:hypothetical protein DHBDCA_p2824 [Dehalobacter sp. DCA]AFV06833.1 hypothetical protein DCF50_p2830 [Dehalobacter sp. CF]EQB21399.1 hypothetical protein UNSWDHB_1303 [Dehalobacter sp. UNSWDHB]
MTNEDSVNMNCLMKKTCANKQKHVKIKHKNKQICSFEQKESGK